MIKKFKFSVLVILLLAVFVLVSFIWPKEDFVLSTNIDFDNKTIVNESEEILYNDWFYDLNHFFNQMADGVLASVSAGRLIYVREGMRKEEIAELIASRLDWNKSQTITFLEAPEGRYYPGVYKISRGKNEDILRELMLHRFDREVENRLSSSTQKIISLPVILKIASIIEREAGGKRDMRLISGVIWNRTFRNMHLDIDATLQYAKGISGKWWPRVLPEDKEIISPYNTYKNKGLPPTPIANPGLASIEAALNPIKTDCLFYIHDKRRRIHCSSTYKGHLKNIDRYY